MPRLRNGELSQTPRAIRQRELTAASRAAARDAVMSSEPLGIKTQRERPPDPDEDQDQDQDQGQQYVCLNCQAPIDYGAPRCGVCEEHLNWEGL